MTNFQLYINNERAELFNDESVSLTQTIQDVKDISKVFTDFSKPFTLPASKENNKIFKHYYNFNLVNGYSFDARKKIGADIYINEALFRSGKLRLEGVDLKDQKPFAYRVTFFGNTVNLKDTLGEDELNGLEWLDNFNTDYDATNILNNIESSTGYSKNSVDDDGTSTNFSKALIIPLISNTVRLWYDSASVTGTPYQNSDGEVDILNGGNLYPANPGSLASTDVHGVYYEDLTYAVQIHLIVRAIVNHPVYDITFSDDFLDLTNGPDAYKNLYMLCQRKEGRLDFGSTDAAVKLVDTFPFDTTSLNNVVVRYSTIYIYNLNQGEVIEGRFTLTHSGAYPDFTFVIKRGSTEVYRAERSAGSAVANQFTYYMENSTEGYTLELSANQSFAVPSISFNAIDPSLNQFTYQTTATVNVSLTREFIVRDHLPNLKVIDFLSGLFKMFNLTAYEQNGVIYIKTLESYYSAGSTRDITRNVDPNEFRVDKALPYEQINFRYKDTGTKLAKQHDQLSRIAWGAEFYNNAEILDSNNETFDLELPFAHLKYEKLIDPTAPTTNIEVQWGWMANENNEPYFEDAVVFNGIFVDTGTSIRFLEIQNDVTGVQDITNYWVPSNSAALISSTSKETINFGLEVNEYTSDLSFTDTLFYKYYRFYIASVFNTSKRLYNIKAKLPKSFLLNYTLADKVTIQDETFTINSITTNLLTGESQLELLNETSDITPSQSSDTGGSDAGQGSGTPTPTPLTNVLTLEKCVGGATFESTQTLATLNLANDRRVEDTATQLDTYKVTGNNTASTHTGVSVQDTGLTSCATTPTPPTTYYQIKKCSTNSLGYRSSVDTGTLSLYINQRVEDGSANLYTVENNTATTATQYNGSTISSVAITAISPTAYACTSTPTTYYYELQECGNTSNTLNGYSTDGTILNDVYVYSNTNWTVAQTATNGSVNIDTMSTTPSCNTYYYSLNDCSSGSIVTYGTSSVSSLAGSEVDSGGTCYQLAATTNTTGSINIDSLSSCSCSTPPTPTPEYYELKDCSTLQAGYRTGQTIQQISLTTHATNGSRVQDTNGVYYIAIGTTTTGANVGAITDLNTTGCPATPPPPTVLTYYALEKCDDNTTGWISQQTTSQITLAVNDRVTAASIEYIVSGTVTAGTSVGPVTDTGNTGCSGTTPPIPPVQPPATTYYATFVTCDDPAGLILQVFSFTQISTWWVLQDGNDCYRWVNNNPGVNPVNINTLTVYASFNTVGQNCIACNNVVNPPPPTPPTPTPPCFTLSLYWSTTEAGICGATATKTTYLNGSTLASATKLYTDNTCGTVDGSDKWLYDGSNYGFWNGTLETLQYPLVPNCQ